MGKEPHKRVHHKWSTLHEPKQQYEREQQQYDVIQADDKQHEAPSPPLVHPSPNHPDPTTPVGFASAHQIYLCCLILLVVLSSGFGQTMM